MKKKIKQIVVKDDEECGDFFCLLFRRYLPKNNQRRREKTPTSLLISQEPTFWPCVKTERTSEVSESRQDEESCNRYTHTTVEHKHTFTHTYKNQPTTKTRTNNVLFSILVYCRSWWWKRRKRRRDEELLTGELKKKTQKKIVFL